MPAAGRVTNPADLGQLNRALQRIDKVEKRLLQTQDQLFQVQKRVSTLDVLHAPVPTTNNLVATWTGSTGTLSWNTSDIQDKNANSLISTTGIIHTTPVTAGAVHGLTPSTHYWMGWSTTQKQMLILNDAHPIINKDDIRIICRVFAGTSGQSGVAGGGGSEALRDLSGLTYKNF
jgi:hypothetical protein